MADTHSHHAQVHRHEHTHVTQDLRHGQQGAHMDTSHDHEHHHAAVGHAPGPGQGRLVLRIGPVIGGCVAVVPSPRLCRVRAELGSWLLRHGG
jgi:ABC-type Zn2+ transport system substrate-binding protein/surface adhesin